MCPVPDRIDGAGGRAFTMLCSIGEPKDQTERVRKGLFLPIPGGGLNAGHRRKEASAPPRTAGIFGPRCPRRSTRPLWSCPTGGDPDSFRNMYFFGEHTFSFYNAKNERVWCKFHHPPAHVAPVTVNIKYRHAVHCCPADSEYGRRMTEVLGLDLKKVRGLAELDHRA